MINLYEKGRIPSNQKEILTKSFLIDKIANEMKLKYKKVFSFINYDEFTLKDDIHFLLSKYISNNKKEINIKYIETTLLNKVKEKYRRKSPFKIKKNLYDKNLIKIVNSSSKKNIYIKNDGNKKNKLPVIKRKNDFILPKIYNKYSGTYDNIDKNENEKLNEINKKINDLEKKEKTMKEEINKEKDEIMILENYKKDIQRQINEINKEMEKEKENQKKEEILNNNINNHIDLNNNNNKNNNIDSKEEEFKEEYNWNYNPSMNFEQMQYLERKQNIEDDYNNKENKYTFLKPYYNENDNNKSISNNSRRPFRYNNVKINNNSTNNMRKKYIKNRILEIDEENNNSYQNDRKNNSSYSNYIEHNPNNNQDNNNEIDNKLKTISYEERMQLKVLQRSLAQEKAFNNLRNILSPEKEYLSESKYQGFNKKNNYEKKNIKLQIVDKARKLQMEKMMRSLDESILEKEKRKRAEKEFDKKYREINEKKYEDFLEEENQKKLMKYEKIKNYRKMLEAQIEQKKKIIFNEESEQPISLNTFSNISNSVK